MLREALTWMTTPCPRPVRAFGYLSEAIATQARGRRQAQAWGPHRAATRSAICAAAANLSQRRTVAVFGAGLIDDIPVAELAALFETVLLVDLLHLGPARQAARTWPNVHLVCADLTALVPVMARLRPGDPLPEPAPRALLDREGIDLVVSANVASQLGVIPVRWLTGNGTLSAEQGPELEAALIGAHLRHLATFGVDTLVISDFERVTRDRQGRVLVTEPALAGLPLPSPEQQWIWPLAPLGELWPDQSLECRVGVWRQSRS
jgi:hypothetical protein